jgi:membrane fusion protein, multidrug efflux system
MFKKLVQAVLGFLAFAAIAAALGGAWFLMMKPLFAGGEQQQPPEHVAIGEVKREVWEITIPAVGSVTAFQGVVVSAEAEGVVREIAFEAGSDVKAGAVLMQLDIEVQQSQLRAAEASADLARSNATRATELFANRTISRAELDGAQAALKQAEAQVDNVRAIIAKRTVRAPFAGRLGIREINVGQFINTGQHIVSLQSLDPVYVEFSLPQQHLAQLQQNLVVRALSDAFPGETFQGRLTAVNPDIDAATRNVRMQATLPNPAGQLRPGMFVNVEIVLPQKKDVLVIPATAVLYAPYGDTVFVVEEGKPAADGKRPLVVDQKIVRTGERRGDFVVITSGLNVGDRIVMTGAFKLRKGVTVVDSPIGVPAPSLAPTPPEA